MVSHLAGIVTVDGFVDIPYSQKPILFIDRSRGPMMP